jgi:arabinogalactan oligomer / maltooligosaccharide transport system permease protein
MNLYRTEAPEGIRGVLIAILTVLTLCLVAFLVGWAVFSGLLSALPTLNIPPWMILVLTLLALVPVLVGAIRLFPWLANWYYLLPALVFVLVFTVYPILLTGYYAFTNYSGKNSGRPDSSTETKIERVGDTQLKILEGGAANLQCRVEGCLSQAIELRDDTNTGRQGPTYTIQSVSGDTLTLNQSLVAGFEPTVARRINPVNFIGFENFAFIFRNASVQLLPILLWTVLFASFTTILNILAGLVLGILLNNKRLKFRNFYRSILILPWAIPIVISVLMWQKLFNTNFGALNRLLGLFELNPAPWLTDGLWAKIAVLLVNLWLGFPYMMTVTLSALSSIPDDLYEAASIDGATRWHQIKNITLPMLTAAFTPIALGTFAFNFNNFGVIYLLMPDNLGPIEPGQLPTAHAADILISWGFKTAFTGAGDQAYGLSSAIAIIVGILTVAISIVNFRAAGVFKEARR